MSDPLSVTPASSQLSLRLTSADMMIIDASLNRCRLAWAATTTSDLPSSSNKFQRSCPDSRVPPPRQSRDLRDPTFWGILSFSVKKTEWKTKENIILKKLSGRDAQQSFLRQFERYARGQYPFDTPLEDGESTLSWWKHLTRIPEGDILAVSLYFTRTNNFTYSHKDPRC
jgi:hypothetical protein